MEIKKDWPLHSCQTFGIDVDCAFYAEVEEREELVRLLRDETYKALPVCWLGGGSNTLFIGDFPGLVVHLANRGMEVVEEDVMSLRIRVQAGEMWKDLVKTTVAHAWWGVENLSGIPGAVGGAVVQNMGAYGVEIADTVQSVEVFDTETCRFMEIPAGECGFSYRSSRFKHQARLIVWSVVLRLSKVPVPRLDYAGLSRHVAGNQDADINAIAQTVLALRRQKLPDPRQLGSVGSFFTNPVVSRSHYDTLSRAYPDMPAHKAGEKMKLSAAWLIDQCGWKGYREGDAGVYEKQPLVLVNHGTASGEEIWDLAMRIKESVNKKFQVDIEPEVCVVNSDVHREESRYKEVLDIMFKSLPMFQRVGAAAYKPDLHNTERLMAALNEPYRRFKSIHVAGTNGKGSCSHILASVFQAAGYKTGLYTSPHMRDFRERIKIDGQMIPKEEVVAFYEKNQALFSKVKASFFEMTVAMAFDYFARERVDIAIIEVGMGGRLDSTNVITPQLSLITNISWDHMQFLGDSLAKIAAEKAGIIKQEVPVVISESQLQTRSVFERVAKERKAPVVFADTVFSLQNTRSEADAFYFDLYKYGSPYLENMACDLTGDSYESRNIIGAACALDVLRQKFDISDAAFREGMAVVGERTGLLGRWQCIGTSPLTYCDTGHNEAGIRLVLQQIAKMPHKRLHIVWGMVKDKDIDHILRLLPRSANYYFCQAPQERALQVEALQEKAAAHGLTGRSYASVRQALEAARKQAGKDDLIYVGGSTFVVAEIC